jgi:hypothetical protein
LSGAADLGVSSALPVLPQGHAPLQVDSRTVAGVVNLVELAAAETIDWYLAWIRGRMASVSGV